MKAHHYYFWGIKILIILLIVLDYFKVIKNRSNLLLVVETIFKISLGIFLIVFFSYNKSLNVDKHDKLLFVIAGVVLIIINIKIFLEEIVAEKVTFSNLMKGRKTC